MFFLIIGLIGLIIFIIIKLIIKKYTNFILNHSILIKNIKEINNKYIFKPVKIRRLVNSYDNETFYENISCKDYLTYQLVYIQKKVKEEMSSALYNLNLYDHYKYEIKEYSIFNQYDIEVTLKDKKLLSILERNIYNKLIQTPLTNYKIYVKLILTNINDKYKTSKADVFESIDIEEIIENLNDKNNNNFYRNKDIWDALCRVERGKVSNKMRFAIYKRDNYRCRKCGRQTDDLEVDHIIPIAKGGKSTYDNLQTLCHRCNSMKSDNIETPYINIKTCPHCGAPLKLIYGKYGKFYGCTNYPRCKYVENV